jgi:hypothetical protein
VIAAQVVLNSLGVSRASWVMEQFSIAGFQVGPFVGVSFSISGPSRVFEEFFKVQASEKEHLTFGTAELPLSALAPDLRKHLDAVLFTKPPDFGPTGQF